MVYFSHSFHLWRFQFMTVVFSWTVLSLTLSGFQRLVLATAGSIKRGFSPPPVLSFPPSLPLPPASSHFLCHRHTYLTRCLSFSLRSYRIQSNLNPAQSLFFPFSQYFFLVFVPLTFRSLCTSPPSWRLPGKARVVEARLQEGVLARSPGCRLQGGGLPGSLLILGAW